MEGTPDLLPTIAILMALVMIMLMISTFPRLPPQLAVLRCWFWDDHVYEIHGVNFDRITREAHEVTRQTHVCGRLRCGMQRDTPIDPPLQEA